MATILQRKVAKLVVEKGRKSISGAMREAGYSAETAKAPNKLTESKGWADLMGEALSDATLAEKHKQLLNSTTLDHMVFPLGPDTDEGDPAEGPPAGPSVPEAFKDRTKLTDKDITELLSEVNCTVRKIVHGETARHVYFWAADNKARKDALDMAYKLKGKYAPEKSITVNVDLAPTEGLKDLAHELIESQRQ